jgi:hypothetical protein
MKNVTSFVCLLVLTLGAIVQSATAQPLEDDSPSVLEKGKLAYQPSYPAMPQEMWEHCPFWPPEYGTGLSNLR